MAPTKDVYLLEAGASVTLPNGSVGTVIKRLTCTQLVKITVAKGHHQIGDYIYWS